MKLSGILLAGLLACVAAVGWAEEGDQDRRISLSITNGNVHDALAMIAQQSGLNISVDSRVKGTVTASLMDVSPAEALRVIAGAVGARVRDDNGVYVVEPKPLPAERPRIPAGGGGARAMASGGATASATATGSSTAGSVAVDDGEIIRVIKLNYVDPAMIAAAFGGTVIGGNSGMLGGSPFRQRGGRSGGRAGYGGYGGSGGYGGYGGWSGSGGWRGGTSSLYSGGGAWGYGGY